MMSTEVGSIHFNGKWYVWGLQGVGGQDLLILLSA